MSDSLEDFHRYPHLGDGKPLSPEILQGVADSFCASMWITMLSSPDLWSSLRRIPPKKFLLERIDAWLAFARKSGQYVYFVQGDERAAAVERRSAPFLRLRALLVDWEPPTVTPEIRDAARALYVAEFLRPPDENWGQPDLTEMPLEAMLLWPEGEWDEAAFVAGQTNNE